MASWKDAPIVGQENQVKAPAWQSAPAVEESAQAPQSIGAGRSMLRGINDGLTFGFADEISSALSATINPITGSGNDADTWRERYDLNVEGERALDRQAREQHPAASAAGGIAGGMLPAALTAGSSLLPSASKSLAGPLSRAASEAAPTLRQAAVEGSAVGAGYGGLYGLGSAEGDLLERAPGAVEGAALGAAVGAAAPAILGGVRSAAGLLTSPDRSAVQQIERAAERDGMTLEQFRRQTDDLQQRYPGAAMPADAGGENMQGLLERVAQTPGAGRTQVIPALTERQQAQPQRITDTLQELAGSPAQPAAAKASSSTDLVPSAGSPLSWTRTERDTVRGAADDLGKATGGGRRTAFKAVEEAMDQRAKASRPLYEQAYREPVPWTHDLEDLFKRPVMQEAYRGAERRAANEGRDLYGKFLDLKDDGSFTVTSVPSTGDLDFVKKFLDSKVGTLERSGDYGEARVIKGIRSKLVDTMDAASPTYKEARAAWAGPSQFIEAVEGGRSVLSRNVSAEELTASLKRMGPAELEGYRIGAVSAIVNKMGNDPSKMADMTKYLRSQEMRGKVAAMLPDDAARQRWNDMLDFETGASTTAGRSLGNSATARRMAEMGDSGGIGGDLVLSALAGTPVGSLFSQIINRTGKGLRDTLRSKSDKAVAGALLRPDGLAAAQRAAARDVSAAPPPLIISRGAGVGSAQSTADHAPRPTVRSLLPTIRERLSADSSLDADQLARETGSTRAAANQAITLARKEQQALATTFKSVPGANKARRGLLDSNAYTVAKAGDREWRVQLKSE
ncbi:hypothetical protein PH586_03680 [Pseudomonas sp. SA3-5]|uniref:Uncharacterized protein n=1 Tax=Pseudomonas aestuarii TaxID=3018340 RepID=A0ABT4XAS4_9PSED|nr:hypothetical protein [Pseudomonas aestuarii]MDA7085492.1 hypothetical protein [Pseudomonas aestuarii]